MNETKGAGPLESRSRGSRQDRIEMLLDRFGEHPGTARELIAALERPRKELLPVSAVEEMLSVSRSTVYRLLREGEFDRVMIDRHTRVTAASVERFVERKIAEARNARAEQ